MTFRATTHEQLRIVLRWVKEHPILAKADTEIEKGGREFKNKLWEKLAIELNELGPSIRSGMAWKRVLTDYKYSLKKKIQRRIANTTQGGSEILASLSELETEALHSSLLDWDFSDPEKLAQLAAEAPVEDSQSLQKSPDDSSNHEFLHKSDSINNGSIEEMDSMNTENLNGNDSSTMMQSIHDSLEGKMEIGDLENDQSLMNGKVQAQVTIPSPNSKSMPRGENYIQLQTVAAEDLTMNGESQMKVEEPHAQDIQQLTVQGQQIIPVSDGLTQPNNLFAGAADAQSIIHSMMMANATPKEYSDALNAAILAQAPQFMQQQQSQAQQQQLQPQQLTQLQQHVSQPQQQFTPQQQQQLNQQQQQHQLNQHNQQQQQMQQQHQMQQHQQQQLQQHQQQMQQQQLQQQQNLQQQSQQVQNQILQQHLQSQQFQPAQQQQTMQQESPVSIQQHSDQQQATAQLQSNNQQQSEQQQPQQTNSEQTPALTPEVMNTLIAREIDRMAVAQKSKKPQQRKRETRDKTKPAQEAPPPPEPKPQKERTRKTPAAEPSDRSKRPPPKKPKPKPKEIIKEPIKKVMRGREFRECLLKLLVEANEMEKRRIAIAETKVRNQTEIQNLEITRMNLEIMKLQKEITLLDHGAKILP